MERNDKLLSAVGAIFIPWLLLTLLVAYLLLIHYRR
jgi:hypothetical protein